MANQITVKNKIKDFNKSITVSGDKSLSIRWVLFSSIAKGKSKAYNLLLSEDVLAAINAVKKLGAKIKLNKNYCTIIGNGPSGYKYRKNITINSLNEYDEIIIIGSGKGVVSVDSIKKPHWKRKSLKNYRILSNIYQKALKSCPRYNG